MRKSTLSLLAAFMMAGSISAQTLPDGMINLLPEGVKTNIAVTQQGSKMKSLVVAGDNTKGYKAFFAATDATHGEELWVTDGTTAGTKMVKDIFEGPTTSNVSWLTRFNDKVVFAADNGIDGVELWISDGTEAGTYMVADIHSFGDSSPRGFVQINEKQFIFAAKDFDSENYDDRGQQWWLYVSDGTADGTELIMECDTKFPGSAYGTSWVTPYCRVGRQVFFKSDDKDGTVGEELWVTDGTRAGTRLVMDINTEVGTTGTLGSQLDQMVNYYNEKLFFKAYSIEYGAEPWATDGTTDGTYQIADTNPAFNAEEKPIGGGVSSANIIPFNGDVLFRGYSPVFGTELAFTNLDKDNYRVIDINKNDPTVSNSSSPDPGVEFDGVFVFCANTGAVEGVDGNYGGEVLYTDGQTVTLLHDRAPGIKHHWARDFTVVSGSLYWWNSGGAVEEDKQKLFRIDKISDEPVRVTNFNANGDQIHTLRNLNGNLLFACSDNESAALYLYNYRKESYDPTKDVEDLSIEFRTRAEIEGSKIETAEQSEKVLLYPNPANDRFSFNVEGEVLSVRIFDLSGRLVKEETQLLSKSVSVASLTQGLYQVVITCKESSYVSGLVVN